MAADENTRILQQMLDIMKVEQQRAVRMETKMRSIEQCVHSMWLDEQHRKKEMKP